MQSIIKKILIQMIQDTDTDTGYIKALSDSNLTRCVF